MLYNLLALINNWDTMLAICIPCLIISALCAIFVIVVVTLQQSNSNGIGALGGQQETFYGKNKSKTIESKLRRLTVVCLVILTVLMIAFYLIQVLLVV